MRCAVFYDVESLRSGKFNTKIFSVIQECTDVIVVFPEYALDRCGDENDWVRKEIVYSIKHNKNIVSVMMRNFQWPKTLPSEMSELQNCNGVSANMEYFDATFEKLLSMLRSVSDKSIVNKMFYLFFQPQYLSDRSPGIIFHCPACMLRCIIGLMMPSYPRTYYFCQENPQEERILCLM